MYSRRAAVPSWERDGIFPRAREINKETVVMSGDLIYRGSYDQEDRRSLLARQARGLRTVKQRAELERAELVSVARYEEVKAMLRKRLVEDGMQDVTDVGRLAQELANGDQWVASLLIPIVQEFARTTARDIRDFGRGR